MENFFDVRKWLELSQDERSRLAAQFNLTKSGSTSVIDNTLVSDGYTHQDLHRLSAGLLISFLGSEELAWFHEAHIDNLISLTLNKIYGRNKKAEGSSAEGEELSTEEVKPKRRGRPKKEKTDL